VEKRDEPSADGDDRQGRLLHVSQAQFWGSLAVSLTIFFFATGPLWKHAAKIDALDTAILWSYAAIPLLIGGCLLVSKRWSLRGFLLDTMALTVVKYVVTASAAIAMWAINGDPEKVLPPKHEVHKASASASEPVITPTKLDPAQTGSITVTVKGADGAPRAGAIAYVAAGLEGFVFAPPSEPVTLVNDGHGVLPKIAAAQIYQRIEGRSQDGRLHTLIVSKDGAAWFNVPLLSSGDPTRVRAGEQQGLASVRCNVHPQAEEQSKLLVLSHPFHGVTDAEGRVTLRRVPAGALRVAAIHETGIAREAAVTLAAGQTAEIALAIAP
jgi:hypothetical protein